MPTGALVSTARAGAEASPLKSAAWSSSNTPAVGSAGTVTSSWVPFRPKRSNGLVSGTWASVVIRGTSAVRRVSREVFIITQAIG